MVGLQLQGRQQNSLSGKFPWRAYISKEISQVRKKYGRDSGNRLNRPKRIQI